MHLQLQIQIDAAAVAAQWPAKNYAWQGPNLTAYTLPGRRFLTLFEPTAEAVNAFYAQAPPGTELVIQPVFDPIKSNATLMADALEFMVLKTTDRCMPWDFVGWRMGLITIDYAITFDDYAAYPANLRRDLEYHLQANLGAGQLLINGQNRALPRWQRLVEFWLRTSLHLAPVLSLMLVSASLSALPSAWLGPTLLVAFGLFFVVGFLLVDPLWAMLMRNWLPRDYLQFIFQGRKTHHSVITKGLVQWLLSAQG